MKKVPGHTNNKKTKLGRALFWGGGDAGANLNDYHFHPGRDKGGGDLQLLTAGHDSVFRMV